MQSATTQGRNPGVATTTIAIEVSRGDNGAVLRGTFKQPPPLVRVQQFSYVQWDLVRVNANDTFVVSFPDASPFSGASFAAVSPFPKLSALSERSGPQLAAVKGNFHYQVFVTDGATGVVYAINNCPELDVDDQ
ncbi:MAG: hypothetical protein JO307_20885 [Bryobacterales bacterium]|nr:hypothetical protein [Bryobacterales bacterium]MBV9400479.1 hypothetical protein [Bryobacterales bacterium]